MKGKMSSAKSRGSSEGDRYHDDSPSDVYAGGSSKVVKEAKGRKHGGRAGGKQVDMHGGKASHRLDRPARKSGGRTGSDMSPFSSAHNVKTPAGRHVEAGES